MVRIQDFHSCHSGSNPDSLTMKIIYNKFIPVKGFVAMNLFGTIFVREGKVTTKTVLNHERIHTAQMKELWYIGFYIIYAFEWLFNIFKYWNSHKAYRNISFEKEAYNNERKYTYLNTRRKFAQWLK